MSSRRQFSQRTYYIQPYTVQVMHISEIIDLTCFNILRYYCKRYTLCIESITIKNVHGT